MHFRMAGGRQRVEVVGLLVVGGIVSLAGCASSGASGNRFAGYPSRQREASAPAQQREFSSQSPTSEPQRPNKASDTVIACGASESTASPTSPPPPSSPKVRPAGQAVSSTAEAVEPQAPDSLIRLTSEERAPSKPTDVVPVAGPAPSIARAETRHAAAPERTVLHANEASFDTQVLRSDVPVLVDFYASWCGPCKALSPVLAEVAAQSPQARVVKVNIDDCPALAARYDVTSIPSLLVFKDGRVVARHKGAVNKTRMVAMLAL